MLPADRLRTLQLLLPAVGGVLTGEGWLWFLGRVCALESRREMVKQAGRMLAI